MDKLIPLIVDQTPKTPEIILDPERNIFLISGRSLPENVVKTYEPVLLWIDKNFGKISQEIIFEFRVDYLNSASAKMISLILTKLEEFFKSGTSIEVHWYFNEDDDDIQSEGEIYAKLKKIPIKLIEIKDEE